MSTTHNCCAHCLYFIPPTSDEYGLCKRFPQDNWATLLEQWVREGRLQELDRFIALTSRPTRGGDFCWAWTLDPRTLRNAGGGL